MKLAIDLTSLDNNFSGIERYALEITNELINNGKNIDFVLIFKNRIYSKFLKYQNKFESVILKGNNKLIFNQFVLPKALLKIKADYYFFPAFPTPFFFFNKNAISAIHDLGCWDCPMTNKKYMTLYFKIMYKKAAASNKKIVTVSNFSKNRIIKILKKDPQNIIVNYNGLSNQFRKFKYKKEDEEKIAKHYNLPDDYILCLSTLEPRKNLPLLLKAYDELLQENKIDIDLVLAGRKGWMVDDLLQNLNSITKERVKFTGFIEDSDLPYVYMKAKLFVFPTMYEGFGIPPIEAMSMNVPVISSNAASMPEILGEAAYYFENNNLKDLKNRIIEVLHISRKELIVREKLGKHKALSYEWSKSAKELLNNLFI